MVAEIKKLSWSSLSLQEPEISLKEESKITGYSEDQLREIKGIAKPETEEEKEETKEKAVENAAEEEESKDPPS